MLINISINEEYELTELSPSDESRLLEIANQPGFLCAPLNARIGKGGKIMPAAESVREFMEGSMFGNKPENPHSGHMFVLREKAKGRRLMGTVGITGIEDREAELGYFLAPELQGKRMATPAICRALQYAMCNDGVTSLRAEVDPENAPSMHLLENLGFQKNGAATISNKYLNAAGQPCVRQRMKVGQETLRDKIKALGYTVQAAFTDPARQR